MSSLESRRGPGPQRLRTILAWPCAIALLSLIGLVSALTGDGLRDLLSWAALAVPVGAIAWAWRYRRR